MENLEPPAAAETFAQALAALKDHHKVNEVEVARRIGVHHSTVNNWAKGKATPRPALMAALTAEFPGFRKRLLDAAGRKAPGPLNPDRESALIEYFRRQTEEQQEITLIQAKALGDSNE